jgi:hypothetical protein
MAFWDERALRAAWEHAALLEALPGVACRAGGAAGGAEDAAGGGAGAAAQPPLCLAPAGPCAELRYDGSPAWAALVPAAAARLGASGGAAAAPRAPPTPQLRRCAALYRGPRHVSCTYAFEWHCAGGIFRARTSRASARTRAAQPSSDRVRLSRRPSPPTGC